MVAERPVAVDPIAIPAPCSDMKPRNHAARHESSSSAERPKPLGELLTRGLAETHRWT
jgi:hypothetical protein